MVGCRCLNFFYKELFDPLFEGWVPCYVDPFLVAFSCFFFLCCGGFFFFFLVFFLLVSFSLVVVFSFCWECVFLLGFAQFTMFSDYPYWSNDLDLPFSGLGWSRG